MVPEQPARAQALASCSAGPTGVGVAVNAATASYGLGSWVVGNVTLTNGAPRAMPVKAVWVQIFTDATMPGQAAPPAPYPPLTVYVSCPRAAIPPAPGPKTAGLLVCRLKAALPTDGSVVARPDSWTSVTATLMVAGGPGGRQATCATDATALVSHAAPPPTCPSGVKLTGLAAERFVNPASNQAAIGGRVIVTNVRPGVVPIAGIDITLSAPARPGARLQASATCPLNQLPPNTSHACTFSVGLPAAGGGGGGQPLPAAAWTVVSATLTLGNTAACPPVKAAVSQRKAPPGLSWLQQPCC